MADILTHLRELSFGYGILSYNSSKNEIKPSRFLSVCQNKIENCSSLSLAQIAKSSSGFSEIEMQTIKNGIKLANFVIEEKIITDTENPHIVWLGSDTQSGKAWDIEINNIYFSLKEDSFVLHNMGLYQIMNIITDTTDYKRGVHIFKEFAMKEFELWFEITRNLAIENLSKETFQTKDSQGKTIKLAYSKSADELYLFYFDNEKRIENFSKCTYEQFEKKTNSKYRDKVFSKFINEKLNSNEFYLKAKKLCAKEAGKNLVEYLTKNIKENPSPRSLFSLFRITDKEYYYAKTTTKSIEVYKVPAQKDFISRVKIKNIKWSVPKSQLNLITMIENIQTKKEIIIRNELRYSHGQLNGVPEAKMYKSSGSLLIAYDKINSGDS